MKRGLKTYHKDDELETALNKQQTLDFKRSYLKTGIFVVIMALLAVVIRFTHFGEHLNVEEMQEMIDGTGIWAPMVFLGFAIILMLIGAPRLVFCSIGGALFGFVEGLALAHTATMIGSLGPFLFARWGTREWVEAKLKSFGRAHEYLRNPSVIEVFLFRQLPILGVVINLFLGSNGVKLGTFLLGSFFGFLPQGIIFTLVGSGIGEDSNLMAASRIWGAVPVLLLTAVVTWRVKRNMGRTRADTSRAAPEAIDPVEPCSEKLGE